MNQEEIKCDKCNDTKNCNQAEASSAEKPEKQLVNFSIAKCIDCDQNYCTSCLLKHQELTLNLNHRLVVIGQEAYDTANLTTEINNNHLSATDLALSDCFKLSAQAYMKKYEEMGQQGEFAMPKELSIQVNEITSNSTQNEDKDLLSPPKVEENAGSKLSEKELEAIKLSNQLKVNQHFMNQHIKSQQDQYEQMKLLGKQQQQNLSNASNARLSLIESEINKTFNFYGQILKGKLFLDYIHQESNFKFLMIFCEIQIIVFLSEGKNELKKKKLYL
jgi:hypothetical protein